MGGECGSSVWADATLGGRRTAHWHKSSGRYQGGGYAAAAAANATGNGSDALNCSAQYGGSGPDSRWIYAAS